MTDTSSQPSLREQKKEETRRALSRAAAELLLAEGTEGMTVAAIAEKAGVSTRTFHNYFPRREDALLLFIEDSLDDFRREVEQSPAGEHPLDTMHRLIVDRLGDGTRPADDPRNPGTLLNLMTIGEHLSTVTGLRDKERVQQHLADGLLEALYRRPGHSLSRPGMSLLLVSALAAGTFAVESPTGPRASACTTAPPWSWFGGVDRQDPDAVLEEGFDLLRSGFVR